MNPVVKVGLFAITALAELGGCYLVFVWTRGGRSVPLLGGPAIALALFAWLDLEEAEEELRPRGSGLQGRVRLSQFLAPWQPLRSSSVCESCSRLILSSVCRRALAVYR